MSHFTKYGKRMRLMLLTAMFTAVMICLFAIPFAEKTLLNNQVGYYSVKVNGVSVGAANSLEDAAKALAQARKRLSNSYVGIVYMEPEYKVIRESHLTAPRLSVTELADKVYSELFSTIVNVQSQVAYTVRINDTAFTLGTVEEVQTLFSRIEENYDTQKEYSVKLNEADSSGRYTVAIEKKETDTSRDIVSAILSGQAAATQQDGTVVHEGIQSIEFEESITVSQVSAANAEIINVDMAYEAVMDNDYLTVLMTKRETYEEEYGMDSDEESEDEVVEVVEDVDDEESEDEEVDDEDSEDEEVDDESDDDDNTESEEIVMVQKVTAEVTYKNGEQIAKKIIEVKY